MKKSLTVNLVDTLYFKGNNSFVTGYGMEVSVMTIKEVEEQTGLARSNIRFYEKEKLIAPSRNDKNGYRNYSEKDIENIKKIAYLRTLEISIEDIRNIISDKVSFT